MVWSLVGRGAGLAVALVTWSTALASVYTREIVLAIYFVPGAAVESCLFRSENPESVLSG